jgi:hypothetical protein
MINKKNKKNSIKKIRKSVSIMHKENKRQNQKKLHIALVLKKKKAKKSYKKGKITRLLAPCKVKTKNKT